MSYTENQNWHQHSQSTTFNQQTNYQQNGQNNQQNQGIPISPVLKQAVNQIAADLKSNMDKNFLKTTTGILSAAEVIGCLLVFIIASAPTSSTGVTLISGFCFWISSSFFLVNFFQIPEKVKIFPWVKAQFGYCAITSILFFLMALINLFSKLIILAFLVVHLCGLFGYHAYDKLKELGRIFNEQNIQQAGPPPAGFNVGTNLNV